MGNPMVLAVSVLVALILQLHPLRYHGSFPTTFVVTARGNEYAPYSTWVSLVAMARDVARMDQAWPGTVWVCHAIADAWIHKKGSGND